MKKIALSVLMISLAMTFLSANGTNEVKPSSSTKEDLTMVSHAFVQNNLTGEGMGTGVDLLKEMKEKLGYSMNFVICNSTEESQQQLFRIGSLPQTKEDMIYVLQSMADKRIVNYLEPLNSYMEKAPLDGYPDDYSQGMLQAFTKDGKLYALPIRGGVWNIWYNKRILTERGFDKVPETPEELYEMAKACTYVKDNGEKVYGFASRGTRWDLHEQLAIGARMFGGDIITPDYKVVINEKPVIDFLKLYRKMYQEGIMPPNWNTMSGNDADQMLKEGRAVFSLGSANYGARYNDTKTSKEAGNLIPIEIPLAKELQTADKKYSDSISFTWAVGILKGSDQKEQAWDAIQFLTTEYGAKEMAKNENAPVRISVLQWQAENDPGAQVAANTLPRTRSALPALENSGKIIDIIGEHVENVVIKGMDAQEEMNVAAEQIKKLI